MTSTTNDAAASKLTVMNEAERNLLLVRHCWQVPYIAHFTWLFQSALKIDHLIPDALEEALLSPPSSLPLRELLTRLLLLSDTSKQARDVFNALQKNDALTYPVLSNLLHATMKRWYKMWARREYGDDLDDDEDNDADAIGADANGATSSRVGQKRKKSSASPSPAPSPSPSPSPSPNPEPSSPGKFTVTSRIKAKYTDDYWYPAHIVRYVGNKNYDVFFPHNASEIQLNTSSIWGLGGRRAIVDENGTNTKSSSSSVSSSSSLSLLPCDFAQLFGGINPLADTLYESVPVRQRIDILYALCEHCLTMSDVMSSAISQLDSDETRLSPFEHDSVGNAFWFFGFSDWRIYRESIKPKPKPKQRKKAKTATITPIPETSSLVTEHINGNSEYTETDQTNGDGVANDDEMNDDDNESTNNSLSGKIDPKLIAPEQQILDTLIQAEDKDSTYTSHTKESTTFLLITHNESTLLSLISRYSKSRLTRDRSTVKALKSIIEQLQDEQLNNINGGGWGRRLRQRNEPVDNNEEMIHNNKRTTRSGGGGVPEHETSVAIKRVTRYEQLHQVAQNIINRIEKEIQR